ncbi:GMC family oxidoreductase N-terminal domain-containing protein [Hoeflea sp. 108]|uniref:GMC family oxidoreductase N-terminal domain-containing protein n=1 Tax=Hoeflea sp. 108 TaxID=1116369 RepID=UPI0031B5663C
MPPRERCPTRPLPMSDVARRLSRGFDAPAWHWWPVEASVISEDYDGRPGCNNCGVCNGCPRGSMNEFATSVWPKAIRAGCDLRTHARVLKVEKGPDGRATGVCYVDRNSGQVLFQKARIVVLAANGIGTPRLLLASDNLANGNDQVGRNLLRHTLVASEMWVNGPVDGHIGFAASLISREFAETDISRGFVNGFNLNCVSSTPSAGELAAGRFSSARAPWGAGHHQWFESHFGHSIGVFAIGDDLPNPENRVTLDTVRTDSDGMPGAKVQMARARTTNA